MTKFILCLLINIGLSVYSFGQIDEWKIDLNDVLRLSCSEVSLSPNFILKIRNYEIQIEDVEIEKYKEINPRWVKTIEVIKNAKILNQYGLAEDETLVIIGFKNRKWKKLPEELKENFKENEILERP